MQHIFLAYGEGQFASTGTGILLSMLAVLLFCIFLLFYARTTYPADQE